MELESNMNITYVHQCWIQLQFGRWSVCFGCKWSRSCNFFQGCWQRSVKNRTSQIPFMEGDTALACINSLGFDCMTSLADGQTAPASSSMAQASANYQPVGYILNWVCLVVGIQATALDQLPKVVLPAILLMCSQICCFRCRRSEGCGPL